MQKIIICDWWYYWSWFKLIFKIFILTQISKISDKNIFIIILSFICLFDNYSQNIVDFFYNKTGISTISECITDITLKKQVEILERRVKHLNELIEIMISNYPSNINLNLENLNNEEDFKQIIKNNEEILNELKDECNQKSFPFVIKKGKNTVYKGNLF
jgi:hypothetical protein